MPELRQWSGTGGGRGFKACIEGAMDRTWFLVSTREREGEEGAAVTFRFSLGRQGSWKQQENNRIHSVWNALDIRGPQDSPMEISEGIWLSRWFWGWNQRISCEPIGGS